MRAAHTPSPRGSTSRPLGGATPSVAGTARPIADTGAWLAHLTEWLRSARRHLAHAYSGFHARSVDARHRDDIDRLLSWGRLVLGVTLVFAVSGGHEPTHPPIAHVLSAAYAIYAAVVVGVARLWPHRVQGQLLHYADLVWATLLTAVSGGMSSNAYPLFMFVIVSGGYRWGLARSLFDGALIVLVAVGLSVSAAAGMTPWPFEIDLAVMRMSYTVILAVLFGALAERQLVLAGQAAALASVVGRIERSPRLGTALREALDCTLQLLDATEAFLVVDEFDTRRTFLWHASRSGDVTDASYSELTPEARAAWLSPLPEEVCAGYARRKPGTAAVSVPVTLALDGQGRPVAAALAIAQPLAGAWPWRSLMFVPFGEREEGLGRLYVLDLDRRPFLDAWLRFLQTLARQLGPLLMSRYLLRRVRTRIGSRERARLSLELHDSLVQSLVALEMRLGVLARRALAGDVAEIDGIRAVLHNEILGVRDLMQELQPVMVDGRRLPLELQTILERFTRSTGTAARLDWAAPTLDLPPRACREVVRVIQEALVNVRRHSGASQVRVRVEADAEGWALIVEDNGHGLATGGRFPHGHPDAPRIGPRVIRQRVTALGGTLTVVSSPAGLRLEMAFPFAQE